MTPGVLSGTRRGPVLTFLGAVGIKRKLWMSKRFIDSEPVVSKVVTDITMEEKGRWQIIDTVQEFEAAKKVAARLKKPATVLGLATTEEVQVIQQAGHQFSRHVFNFVDFWAFVSRLDKANCHDVIQ